MEDILRRLGAYKGESGDLISFSDLNKRISESFEELEFQKIPEYDIKASLRIRGHIKYCKDKKNMYSIT